VRYGVFFSDKKIVGECISQNAIDFLGHAAIKATEPGFDVSYADAKFRGGQRNGDGGIHVANNENKVGFAFDENRLDALQNLGGLRGVGAGADFQIYVGRRNAHLAKENVGQLFVVVLSGVDEDGFDFGMTLHLAHERRNFWEIGACSDDIQDFQALSHERSFQASGASIASGKLPFDVANLPFAPKKH